MLLSVEEYAQQLLSKNDKRPTVERLRRIMLGGRCAVGLTEGDLEVVMGAVDRMSELD